MEKTSVLEKLKALDKERAALLEGAKAEALEKAENAVADLNDLGFRYRLIDETEESWARITGVSKAAGEIKRQQRDIPCPICGFKTIPLHDGRAHRSQEPKKPFTADELAERGFLKVE
jgi:hypothetical protein